LAIFPDRLKYVIIKPLFKKGGRFNLANYLLIFLLRAFAKLFEIVVFCRVSKHFQVHNKLIPEQYRFRKGLSTIDAMHICTDSILQAWNNKTHTGGTFCGLSKAFDSMNHKFLLQKLKV
jgi:hypothetical protein